MGKVTRKLSKPKREKGDSKKPNPVDVHVCSRVRLRRMLLGMSQEKLGETLGLTFQQVQKYEKGTNRIGASRLHQIGNVLGVPVSYFFEDLTGDASAKANDKEVIYLKGVLDMPEGVTLVTHFVRIEQQSVRRKLVDLVKVLATPA